ncbi:MAG: SUMF1/EgtB/PvdO family nonheme iron enzyme [Gammaproteobacteria bacterium]
MAEPAAVESGTEPDSDAIEVIAYTPGGAPPPKTRRITPLRVLLFLLLLLSAVALWFVFTSKAVWVQITPTPDSVELQGGWPRISYQDHYLMRSGELQVAATKEGYVPLNTTVDVSSEPSQRFVFELEKLPGYANFRLLSPIEDATVAIDNAPSERLAGSPFELKAGRYSFVVSAPRYQDYTGEVVVEGLGKTQQVELVLKPNWADVTVQSSPEGADVVVGETVIGQTPGTFEIVAGEHQLTLRARGYKVWFKTLNLSANEALELPLVNLVKADGTVTVTTTPSAAITVNGQFRGMSPQTFKLPPGKSYTVAASKVGFRKASRVIQATSDQDLEVNWTLQQLLGEVIVTSSPPRAEVWQDGRQLGVSGELLLLPVNDQSLTIRASGYAPQTLTVLPSPQERQTLTVSLLTVEQAREAELARKRSIVTKDGQTLLLQRPKPFKMGASRRVRGRRANETLRDVSLTRLYYIGTHEVSNARFKAFSSTHSSGTAFKVPLDDADAPVVNVSWDDAARYCNWLSEQEGLPLAYTEVDGNMKSVIPATTGYRLPTEPEWAWAARFSASKQPTLLPWGDALPPPEDYGNFAGRAAIGLVNRVFDDYDDSYAATAPIGSFAADVAGLYDMAGNVSEWTNDVYLTGSRTTNVDARVVRGSSWQHSRIGELRFTYRDSSKQPRNDIGFRIARYLE